MTPIPEKPRRLGLDVDEVVAQLHLPWIRWIHGRFNDVRIDPAIGFLSWDHPEDLYGKAVFDFLHPIVYDSDLVQPYPLALLTVDLLRHRGYVISWVTSCLNGTAEAKLRWMRRHRLFQDGDTWLPDVKKQQQAIDILVDDASHNLVGFPGLKYLVTRAHNVASAGDWERITDISDLLWRLL